MARDLARNRARNLASNRIVWSHLLTVGSAGILVGTELVALTWAAGWALGGFFDLPFIIRMALEVTGAGLGLLGVYYFVRAAMRVEPVLDRDSSSREGSSGKEETSGTA